MASFWLYLLAPTIIGILNAFGTRGEISSPWYDSLKKPWFKPPPYVFRPVWSVLYICLGYSIYRIQETPDIEQFSTYEAQRLNFWTICLFWFQLVVLFIWPWSFFVKKDLIKALINMVVLWVLAGLTTALFYYQDKVAGISILPYFTWITLATMINYTTYQLNKAPKKEK
ncbi:hypothetical protein DSO57_1032259 [Entomophthora muscae]|uniref:Uncharacterized protein n=1 Tax=Entomophthora muscae TaxID=34485 RepID=A0ACC2TMU2_9FUNG|nr:hypothetical protein DSO57_1032259 [Entomophthora muscae]